MLFWYGFVQDMLAQSRQEHSGIQLEVNERILDSCTSLMMVSSLLHIQYRFFLKTKTLENIWKIKREFYCLNILWTCALQAIKVLILKSKILQKEIVGQGRGTASATEFYKKHHRWTEGLISAAKAVGWGANVLVYVFIIFTF